MIFGWLVSWLCRIWYCLLLNLVVLMIVLMLWEIVYDRLFIMVFGVVKLMMMLVFEVLEWLLLLLIVVISLVFLVFLMVWYIVVFICFLVLNIVILIIWIFFFDDGIFFGVWIRLFSKVDVFGLCLIYV